MLILRKCLPDINRKLLNIQVISNGKNINTKSKPYIAPTARLSNMKSPTNDTDDGNWWSHAKLAITNIRMRGYSNQQYWDKVVPVKLNVVHPRPVPDEPKPPPEQYSVACHVPYDHGNKYSLHKIDPSYNIRTEGVRPIHLKVIVPASNDSQSQQRLLKEPNIMASYPASLRRDK